MSRDTDKWCHTFGISINSVRSGNNNQTLMNVGNIDTEIKTNFLLDQLCVQICCDHVIMEQCTTRRNLYSHCIVDKIRLETFALVHNEISGTFKVQYPHPQKKWSHMLMLSNGNIFRVTGPLWGESAGHRWITLTKASDAELGYFLWSAPEQTDEQTIEAPVIWNAIAFIMLSF